MVQLDSTVSEADLATFVGKSVLVIGHVGMNMAALEKAREMLGAGMVLEMEDRLTYASLDSAKYDAALVGCFGGAVTGFSSERLVLVLRALKPGGKLVIGLVTDNDEVLTDLRLTGFTNIASTSEGTYNDAVKVTAEKTAYEVGAAVKLSFAKKKVADAAPAWKPAVEDEDDLLDEDSLLNESDRIAPVVECGPAPGGNPKKACKNCSCGLAEEESKAQAAQVEESRKKVVNTAQVKSSCGNCSLGDAFRCGTCPYKGMPAFKPGEQIVITQGDDLEGF